MGKWDRRWMPRRRYNNRKYKDYDYEEPPPSPPSPHHSQSNPPAIQDGSGSSWEMDFCKSVRVPWQKIVTAKKYMHCHENVLHWDDSAGEQAFQNAKLTYWEKINSLPSKTPIPHPDIYTDKVDWNPKIDPGLMADLDVLYFNPDETESSSKLDTRTEKVHNQDPGCDSDNASSNPWERGSSHKVNGLKGQTGNWSQNDKSISVKNASNPWEQNFTTSVEASKNIAWTRHEDQSSCWDQELKHYRQGTVSKSTCDTYWNRGYKDGGYFAETGWRQDGWTRGWKPSNIGGHYQQSSGNNVSTWQSDFVSHTRAPWNKVWEDKQLKNNFKSSIGSERPNQSGCRKRDGSFQNRQRYKASRLQVDDHGASYQCQKERSHTSVRFYV